MLSVTPHKYWRARVNGQPVEPRIVNIAYQAVELPAGRHVVEMDYWNPLVVPSLVVSLLALLAAIVVAVMSPSLPAQEIPAVVAEVPAKKNKRKIRK